MANVLFINFKNYRQAFEGFPKLYQNLEAVARRYPAVGTFFAPPPLFAAKIADATDIPLWAQHSDPLTLERGTGFLPAEGERYLGIKGTFLNHSEHPMSDQDLAKAVELSHNAGLSTMIFADSIEAISRIRRLEPNYIAYEPPELIAGDVSVTSARAAIIPEAVEAARPTPLLVGAGIRAEEDIQTALKLGAIGAVVSSAIVTASDPAAALDRLLSAY